MPEPMDPKNVDKRTYERYLRAGWVDEKAFEKHLKSLPDVTEKGTVVETTMDDADFEDGPEE